MPTTHRTLLLILSLISLACSGTYQFGPSTDPCTDLSEDACIDALRDTLKRSDPDGTEAFGLSHRLKALCNAGTARACAALGASLSIDRPDPFDWDRSEADTWFQKSCDLGLEAGCSERARMWASPGLGRDLPKAISIYTGLCDAGDTWSCTELGRHTMLGEGVKADPIRARDLWQPACEAGDGPACAYLGTLHLDGADGVPVDLDAARTALERGCAADHRDACHRLSVLLADPAYDAKDPTRARSLAETNCDAGWTLACDLYGVLLIRGTGGAADPERGRALIEKACAAGEQHACANLQKLGASAR